MMKRIALGSGTLEITIEDFSILRRMPYLRTVIFQVPKV